MKYIQRAAAAALAAGMILSLTACDEEPAVSTGGSNADGGTTSASAPGAVDSAPSTSATTTTWDTDPNVIAAVDNIEITLDNPDLKVTKRLKWMAWEGWEQDETTAAGELFKKTYGIPETGDDPDRAGRIFESINISYGERYDKLSAAIQAGDSPDLFPFELRDFPFGVVQGRYQAIGDIIDFSTPKWDSARQVLDQFKLNGKYYCAIYELNFQSLLYYRKSVIEDLGLDDPRELFDNNQWTWDTFLDMGRKFQQSVEEGYTLIGWQPENELFTSAGTPLVGNDGTKIINNLYNANVERGIGLLQTLQKENLRYPVHEKGYQVNPKEWADGKILFYANGGQWEFEGKAGLRRWGDKYGWDDDEIRVVVYPRDPNADAYYHAMKQDAMMWCKGSTNKEGVAAWIDCNVTTALDPAVVDASIEQLKTKHRWTDDNIRYIYQQKSLDGSSSLTPLFDFKNGLGEDISDAGKSESPVETLTKTVYLQGTKTYTQLREENFNTIDDRINELNTFISKM